jgi:hypothetical protein
MPWFLLNIPPAVAFFLAITGIPAWLVIRHPDQGPAGTRAAGRGVRDRRDLVGASTAD